jgi:hypothetical protein
MNDTEYSPWMPSGVGQQYVDDDCEHLLWMPSGISLVASCSRWVKGLPHYPTLVVGSGTVK